MAPARREWPAPALLDLRWATAGPPLGHPWSPRCLSGADTGPMRNDTETATDPTVEVRDLAEDAGHEVRVELRKRLAALPEWVLSDAMTPDAMVPRLWVGWQRVHAVAFFGMDTSVVFSDGQRWALWTYRPQWLQVDDTEEIRWVVSTAEDKRAALDLLVRDTLVADTLPDLFALIIDTHVDQPSEVTLTGGQDGDDYAVEAMVTAVAEAAERRREGGRHLLAQAHPWGTLVLDTVATMQSDIAEALTDEEESYWRHENGQVPDGIHLATYSGNPDFVPRGCVLHDYPTA